MARSQTRAKTKPVKKSILILGPIILAVATAINAGELLGHISEDTSQPITDKQPAPSDDRRIIYRVICSPGDEALPDCEKSLVDNETAQTPKAIEPEANEPEMVQEQQEQDNNQEARPTTAKSAKSKAGKRKTQSGKKSKTSKKPGSKKVTTKKTTSKKKKH